MGLDRLEGRHFGTVANHDRRAHHLAPLRIGHADDRHVRERRVIHQCRFDLGRRHRLAAGTDDVLYPADDRVEAFIIERGDIAGAEPAVGGERLGGCLGVVKVAVEQQRSVRLHLAGDRVDADGARVLHRATRAGLALHVGVAQECHGTGLGRAVEHATRGRGDRAANAVEQ
ncbi:unannotated protein [freshwater metagenome]|uniref:Unannotated protein n=1 Tax=freshwater metagenome TaxID=449393 RepID=A0A6J7NNR9_9ZZZZ